MNVTAELERGRELHAERSWRAAYSALAHADQETALAGDDLERLATAAYMLGRQDEYFDVLGRAHEAYVNDGEVLLAARCALWIGITLAQQGNVGRANAWLGRARRLVARQDRACVEQGYLLLPHIFEQEARGDLDGAIATARQAAELAERFGEADLAGLANQALGDLLVSRGRVREGLELLDEAMLAVTNGELSPIPSGIVYCGVILGCEAAHDPRRAQEWTAALASWCQEQPDMVAFTGRCLVHRTEILGRRGDWSEALEEARRAARRCLEGQNQRAAGQAAYLQGELQRLRGRSDEAEEAYREASRLGREPQPGLALLRAAEGRVDAALAAIRRALAETTGRPERANLLPAHVEIALAASSLDEASSAAAELEEIAAEQESALLEASALRARGAVALAGGDPQAALVPLRRAAQIWQELDAPYECARTRVLVGEACLALGDEDTAALEQDAARDAFAELGAQADIDALERPDGNRHGLTARELEILALVAAGHSNKAIAAELVLSERTVERHLSNVFAKLGVSSRAAATAFAYEHRLL